MYWNIANQKECPWTCGDSRTAVECGEEFGHTEILIPVEDGDEVIAYLPHEPLADAARLQELAQRGRLIAEAPELAEVLAGLFKHCAMVHKHWGEGDNTKQANEMIERGRVLLAYLSPPDTPPLTTP